MLIDIKQMSGVNYAITIKNNHKYKGLFYV